MNPESPQIARCTNCDWNYNLSHPCSQAKRGQPCPNCGGELMYPVTAKLPDPPAPNPYQVAIDALLSGSRSTADRSIHVALVTVAAALEQQGRADAERFRLNEPITEDSMAREELERDAEFKRKTITMQKARIEELEGQVRHLENRNQNQAAGLQQAQQEIDRLW